MFSIICVYNDKQILNEWLLKSLSNQTTKYELILLDNTQKKFKSAADALNNGGKSAKNEYLMFVHQDVDLLSNDWLEKAESFLKSLPEVGVAGVAGKKDNSGIFTNINHGIPPKHPGGDQINRVMEVQTVDECLVIIPRFIFSQMEFDENVCDNWHLYVVDYCLSIRERGFKVFILPISAYHKSEGLSIPFEYFWTLKKIIKKHNQKRKKIFTTVRDWNTSSLFWLQMVHFYISRFIRRIILKMQKWHHW